MLIYAFTWKALFPSHTSDTKDGKLLKNSVGLGLFFIPNGTSFIRVFLGLYQDKLAPKQLY